MITSTWENLRLELRRWAPWLVPTISTCTSNGTTTTLIDTLLYKDTSADVRTANELDGMWCFRPDATAPDDREVQIAGLTASTGTLAPVRAWANAPQSADQYEIWAVRPKDVFITLQQVLRELKVPSLQPLLWFTDSDMEVSDASNWTDSGGINVLAKVTTSTYVLWGKQWLHTTLDGSFGYARSVNIPVVPGRSYEVSVPVYVAAGGPAYLMIYDMTNTAEIELSGKPSASAKKRHLVMQRTFTAPSTCYEVAVCLQGTATSDDIYWGPVYGPRDTAETLLPAPRGLSTEDDLRKLQTASYSLAYANNVYVAQSRTLAEPFDIGPAYHVRSSTIDAISPRIELRQALPPGELWAETLRPGADVYTMTFDATGETSPTLNIDRTLLSMLLADALCQQVLANNSGDVQARSTRERLYDRSQDINLPDLRDAYRRNLESPAPVVGRVMSPYRL